MTGRLLRSAIVFVLAAAILAAPVAPAFAQQQQQAQQQSQTVPSYTLKAKKDYSRGQRSFPNLLAPYGPISVPKPDLTDSPRVDQLIQDGKMQLSLQDALALALENNLDIAVQRYIPWIADTDILRTKGGGAARGLAGTGTASALGSIPSENFDPLVTTTLSLDHRNTPVNNPFTSGTGVALSSVTNHTNQANFGYSQGFHTGTAVGVTWNNSRVSTSSPAAIFNPSVQSTLFVSFTQQLLNGFGLLANTRFIRIAKISKKIADEAFQQQVITTVTNVQFLYWELVFAREDVKVKQRSVDLAEKLYTDNKRQVEIGTLAPIEVTRAEAEVARTRGDLIVSQSIQLQQQTLLKNAITKNPLSASLLNVEITPTDSITQPPIIETISIQDAVREALTKRPDVLQAQQNLNVDDINVKATRNALLPTLSLFGQYGWTGLAGNSKISGTPTGLFTANTGSPIVNSSGTPQNLFPSIPVLGPSSTSQAGLTDAFGNIFGNDFPTYSLQLSLSIPIRNRPAQADSARAILTQRQNATRLQQIQNNVVVDVRNTQIALEQDRARVETAVKSRVLAEQTLDAEQKKYQLGASTIFLVIQAQRDLASAQSVEVRALVDLIKAKADFERALARTIEVNHITIADAQRGRAPRETLIPGSVTGEIVGPTGKF